MDAQSPARIPSAFATMPDPRHHDTRHKLLDIITIAILFVQ